MVHQPATYADAVPKEYIILVRKKSSTRVTIYNGIAAKHGAVKHGIAKHRPAKNGEAIKGAAKHRAAKHSRDSEAWSRRA